MEDKERGPTNGNKKITWLDTILPMYQDNLHQ